MFLLENWIPPEPERKVWHPIVWQQAPPPIPPELAGLAGKVFIHLIKPYE